MEGTGKLAPNPDAVPWDVQPAGSKLKAVLVSLVVLLVLGLGAGLYFLLSGTGNEAAPPKDKVTAIFAFRGNDGACIVAPDGKRIEIEGSVQTAFLCPNLKDVVVFLRDGTLYVTDTEQTFKNVIAEDVLYIGWDCSDGFFFKTNDYYTCRVCYNDLTTVQTLGKSVICTYAENTCSVLYLTEDGGVYAMANTEEEGRRVGSCEWFGDRPSLISDDGKFCAWASRNKNGYTVWLAEDGQGFLLDEIVYDQLDRPGKAEENRIEWYLSPNQNTIAVTNYDGSSLLFKTRGAEPVEVLLEAPAAADGVRFAEEGEKAALLYVLSNDDVLYQVSLNGSSRVIQRFVKKYEVSGSKLAYLNGNSVLKIADISGGKLTNETRVASNVDAFELAGKGQYIYYITGYQQKKWSGALSCYKLGDEAPQTIAGNVFYCADRNNWISGPQCCYTEDGAAVFFYMDMELSAFTATLAKWSYGDAEATCVSKDVVVFTLTSERNTGEIDPNSFYYRTHVPLGLSGRKITAEMYHNGLEAVEIGSRNE